jgi:hypothetical protein
MVPAKTGEAKMKKTTQATAVTISSTNDVTLVETSTRVYSIREQNNVGVIGFDAWFRVKNPKTGKVWQSAKYVGGRDMLVVRFATMNCKTFETSNEVAVAVNTSNPAGMYELVHETSVATETDAAGKWNPTVDANGCYFASVGAGFEYSTHAVALAAVIAHANADKKAEKVAAL